MESNQLIQLGEHSSAILVSGNVFNDEDGLLWPTGGRFSSPSGLRRALLVVSQATAQVASRQQTWKTGQVIPYDRNLL